jgi:transketolase
VRNAACESWSRLAKEPNFVFLTGDLGFSALEPLGQAAGSRFINAGISEQNMVSVAAGLAKTGLLPWVYSIAPFCYARGFEQIRNDVCLHQLPVKIVGNGGGYGYGVMGPTHHAIEDYGALLSLQHLRVWVPAFKDDVWPAIEGMWRSNSPGYLRLGRCEKPKDFEVGPYAPIRKLVDGDGPVYFVVGPLVGTYLTAATQMPFSTRPEIWSVSELPLGYADFPDNLKASLGRKTRLLVVEEHVRQGSFGQSLAHDLLAAGVSVSFRHAYAQGYLSGRYGSQKFHRTESHLGFEQVSGAFRDE